MGLNPAPRQQRASTLDLSATVLGQAPRLRAMAVRTSFLRWAVAVGGVVAVAALFLQLNVVRAGQDQSRPRHVLILTVDTRELQFPSFPPQNCPDFRIVFPI